MANAILYYRTTSSRKDQYDLPTTSNFPAGQKLEFDINDNLLEGINFQYTNNIIDIPVPISDGTRKINKQENGLKSIVMTINGRFKVPSGTNTLDTDIAKLRTMSARSNIDASHPYGNIGFYSPNSGEFSIDPNASNASTPATRGLTISGFQIGFITPKIKTYGFQVTLNFGGTWTG